MFKLLFTLGTFLVVALSLLALRQRRLELTSESVQIHDRIMAREQTLWGERVEIAQRTNPWALNAGLKAAGIDTGAAMSERDTGKKPPGAAAAPGAIETDLVAPVQNGGHANPNRPH